MQKSFRRREQQWLELYLSGLLTLDPAYAWSRFATVVMEDASTAISGFREAYAALLWLSTAKYKRLEFGVTVDDLIRFARFFHDFGRCRAACDTVYSIHNEPAWSDLTKRVAGWDLIDFQAMDAPLATKLALAAAVGRDRQKLLAGLLSGAHPIDRWIAMKGLKMHEGGMAIVYPAIVAEDDSEFEIDEQFPPSIRIGDYPGYTFDIHVRDGIAALRDFLKNSNVPFVSQLLDLLSSGVIARKPCRPSGTFCFGLRSVCSVGGAQPQSPATAIVLRRGAFMSARGESTFPITRSPI